MRGAGSRSRLGSDEEVYFEYKGCEVEKYWREYE